MVRHTFHIALYCRLDKKKISIHANVWYAVPQPFHQNAFPSENETCFQLCMYMISNDNKHGTNDSFHKSLLLQIFDAQ